MKLRIRASAICHCDDKILLAEHEKEGETYFLLPGGGMQPGEHAREAVAREVLEETAIQVRPDRLVCICESIAPDRQRHIIHFIYHAAYLTGEPGISQDPRVRRCLFQPIESVNRLPLRPPIQEWLHERLRNGFLDAVEYLGALWA